MIHFLVIHQEIILLPFNAIYSVPDRNSPLPMTKSLGFDSDRQIDTNVLWAKLEFWQFWLFGVGSLYCEWIIFVTEFIHLNSVSLIQIFQNVDLVHLYVEFASCLYTVLCNLFTIFKIGKRLSNTYWLYQHGFEFRFKFDDGEFIKSWPKMHISYISGFIEFDISLKNKMLSSSWIELIWVQKHFEFSSFE